MTSDETRGWIFTDAYHRWQDSRSPIGDCNRHGGEVWASALGWATGLYTIKTDFPGLGSADWPVPRPSADLDKNYR